MKTYKLLLTVFFIIFIAQPVFSQIYRQWTKTVNGTINNEDQFSEAAVDNSGNIYLTGIVYNSPTGRDIIARKYNSAGDLIWQHDHSSNVPDGQDGGVSILYKNGFVYILGDVESITGGKDIIVIKRNAETGSLLWSKIYNGQGNGNDHAYAITLDIADNVYLCGMSHNGNDFDMLIVKYNSTGGLQWDEVTGFGGFDYCSDIKTDNSGNVYACGTDGITSVFSKIVTLKFQPDGTGSMYEYLENGVDSIDAARKIVIDAQGNVYTCGYVKTLSQDFNTALVKYNPSGSQQWIRYYNGSSNGSDVVQDMKIDAAGNIYLAGYSFNSASNLDYITLKYNTSGTNLWAARYIGNYLQGDNIARSIALDAQGNVYVTGNSRETQSGSDITTVKYNSTGALQWAMKENGSVNTSYQEVGFSIVLDDLNNVFVAGKNDAPDGILFKYVQAPIGIQTIGNEIPQQFELRQNYPNPFNPVTNVEFSIPKAGFTKLVVYDILGKEISVLLDQDLKEGRYNFNFDASALSSGVYFYKLISSDFVEVKKMNLIK